MESKQVKAINLKIGMRVIFYDKSIPITAEVVNVEESEHLVGVLFRNSHLFHKGDLELMKEPTSKIRFYPKEHILNICKIDLPSTSVARYKSPTVYKGVSID